MQRRIKPAKLQENFYGTLFPKPSTKVIDMSVLDGGLNLWELPYRMDKNQSPDCVNVYWKDGCLKSRPGQEYLSLVTGEDGFHACYNRVWHGKVVAHIGKDVYAIDPVSGVRNTIYHATNPSFDTDDVAGFFVFDDKLYYIGAGRFMVWDSSFNYSVVPGYTPTVVMNMRPNGTGGTSYQPENRVAAGKKIFYTSDGTSTVYQLPYKNLDDARDVTVEVNTYDPVTQTYEWVTRTDITLDKVNGTVTFDTAPAQEDPENPNNVSITCYKTNAEARANILNATCLAVYGGDSDLAVVVGGCPSQPNAYYWSGNTSKSLDPSYFPMDYYNFAGTDIDNKITGFGRQQGLLIIFQEHTIGKSYFGTTTVNDRTLLTLNYTNINAYVGCDVPGSIQLCHNNLVFANTYGGVYLLANSTPADENNVRRLSKNVNGSGIRGLLIDLVKDEATSFDDTERYWLITNGKAYVWDYGLRGYTASEENLTWFYFTNINGRGTYEDERGKHYYFTENGSVVKFTPNEFNDFDQPIERKYTFAVQNFGTYEAYKDVLKIVLGVRSDTRSTFGLHYQTDWEERDDRTPIYVTPPGIDMLPYDLTDGYDFDSTVYAGWATRIPRTFHIQHFGMTIYNNVKDTDIGVVSAQIFYRYVRDARESRRIN